MNAARSNVQVEVNGRSYRAPGRPVVVICYDGCDPAYLADAAIRGLTPALSAMMAEGFYSSALSAMPSFTNPNNVSIVCGAPPRVHGVSGNYWFDRDTGKEVMMTDAGPLRAPTILARLAAAGVKVAAVTAKDKLRKVLAAGLAGPGLPGLAFSAERADTCTVGEHGLDAAEALGPAKVPDQYSPELSLFVLDAGLRLLGQRGSELVYLSLSDFVQHAHAPGAAASDDFIRAVDARMAAFLAAGAIVGVVADHGMTDLSLHDGSPNILYLGDLLDQRFGAGRFKVICPITDPFVRHHGALGGFVRVHVLDGSDPAPLRDFVAGLPGVHLALTRDEACARFDLPPEREGDVTVVAEKGVALGTRQGEHRLDELAGARLRSHGSLAERPVPFVLSQPLNPDYRARARAAPLYNYDIFDFALNGTETA
ncbi:phosphonoacetate hydrolase [Phreatobacter stygius]|uniref:Phosphonoacetate hydrolase n=1 Tax=Phreatobacter stygius TaxID=1940610 RepID=A0A4D7BCI4_9HYPH|nr:phosphonoacetate hydrolase [Phreatobacter stygius]QCI68333.1 phosphonoacetate hydrolase [Phreatobacter stygius]